MPVNAHDNMTSDVSYENNDYLGVIGDVNQSEDSIKVSSFNDNNLTDSGDVYLDNSTIKPKIVYHRLDTKIYSDDFAQFAVDNKAGEKGGSLSVMLVDENNKLLSNQILKIGFNGIVYNITTDEIGCARLPINLAKAGTYTFAIAFLGSNSYQASMNISTVKISKKPTSIVANAKTFKSNAKTKKYTITLKTSRCSSSNGKVYLSAGKKITLKLNGKTYTAKTNKNGKATFNLKITKKGKSKATIKFAGDNTYKSSTKTAYITIK